MTIGKKASLIHACKLKNHFLDLTYHLIRHNNPLLLKFLRYDEYTVVATKIIYIYISDSPLLMDGVETNWIPASTDPDTVNPITLISQSLIL